MPFNPTIWASAALSPLMDSEVLIDKVNRQWENDAKSGEAVEIPLLGSITAQSGQSTDTDFTLDPSGESSVKILIDQETFAGLRIKDVDELQSNVGKTAAYSAEMAKTIKQGGMTLNLASYMAINAATANRKQFTEIVTDATTITYPVLLKLRQMLNEAKMPMEDRYLVVTPEYEAALWSIYDDEGNRVFISKDYQDGSNSFEKGIIAKGLGFSVVMTTNMPTVTTAGAISATPGHNTQSCILAFQKNAIAAVIQKDVTFKSAYNTAKRANDIVASCIWGRKVVFDTGIICVRENTP
jgi:hypothetical protein